MTIRVLLADDEELISFGLRTVLESTGGVEVVAEAGNRADGVRAATALRPDVVLIDTRMPVMDGLAAIRAIRARECAQGCSRTPIKTLTANALPEHAVAALAAGADDHLTKPISAIRLIAAVQGVGANAKAA